MCTISGLNRAVEGFEVVAQKFDPELYLRMAGEKCLLEIPDEPNTDPWSSELYEIASALVAVDVIDEKAAQGILDDYQLAMNIRGRGNAPIRSVHHPVRGRRQAMTAPRVVSCGQAFDLPWGKLTVHYVILGSGHATVSVDIEAHDLQGLLSQGGPGHRILIADDQGHSSPSSFAGSGRRAGQFTGHLTTMQPLAIDAKWLDVGSSRVQLSGEVVPPKVAIEQLPATDPVERYLWSRLSSGRHGPHMGGRTVLLDAAIDTLVAAGALESDNPTIGEARDVMDAFSGKSPTIVTTPWGELIRGMSRQGRHTGIVPLGAVSPVFDDSVINFEALSVADGNFELHVQESPNTEARWTPTSQSLAKRVIEWWAEDDLGNPYLGSIGSWGGSPDLGQGTVSFWPALDPRAKVIRLMPTGPTERVVVNIELPHLEEPK